MCGYLLKPILYLLGIVVLLATARTDSWNWISIETMVGPIPMDGTVHRSAVAYGRVGFIPSVWV